MMPLAMYSPSSFRLPVRDEPRSSSASYAASSRAVTLRPLRSLHMDAQYLVRQKEPMTDQIPSTQTYMALLASIKERIQGAQVRAALAVNRELILLYWGIGSEITRRQKEEGWGTKSLTLWPGTCQQL